MLVTLFVIFVALMLIGLDIGYAMGVASLAYLWILPEIGRIPIPATVIPQKFIGGVDSFPLLAVPMFLLAGELMSRGGMTIRLVHLAAVLVGHIKGGIAQVAIVANVIMAGMSGSAVADAAATGALLIPAMVKRKYPADFASAVIASASTIGPIIPPSIPMVIIGSLVSVSVGQLFVGGVVPGLLMGAAMMVYTYRFADKHKLAVEPRATAREIALGFKDGALALLAPVIILGSILGGVATPTEASVIAVVYALVVGVFVYKDLKPAELPALFTDMGVATAVVMITVGAAQAFGWITAAEGLGNLIGTSLRAISADPWVILLVINLVLLVLGMFMEPIPIMILTVPILFPIVTRLGIDPVHFGVVVTLNLMIGALTPPVGLNLFVASSISGVPVMVVARASYGFIISLVVVLGLITYIPSLVTWLPRLVYGVK